MPMLQDGQIQPEQYQVGNLRHLQVREREREIDLKDILVVLII